MWNRMNIQWINEPSPPEPKPTIIRLNLNRHKFSSVYRAISHNGLQTRPFLQLLTLRPAPSIKSRILSNSRFSFWKWARVVLISESSRRDTLSAPRSFASLANYLQLYRILRNLGVREEKKGTGPVVLFSPLLITILATRNETDYLGVSTGYPHNFWSEQIRY